MAVGVIVAIVVGVIIALLAWFSYRSTYYRSDPMLDLIRSNFAKLDPRFANLPIREGNGSYTLNRSYITLCLRDPRTGQYYHPQVVMYVALHELAHTLADCERNSKQVTIENENLNLVSSGIESKSRLTL